jgi:hypothetical protein
LIPTEGTVIKGATGKRRACQWQYREALTTRIAKKTTGKQVCPCHPDDGLSLLFKPPLRAPLGRQ